MKDEEALEYTQWLWERWGLQKKEGDLNEESLQIIWSEFVIRNIYEG